MPSTPIRQPRGPSANAFGTTSPAPGPPTPDNDSLRRSNTVSNPRQHQVSASISSTPAASSAFHGAKFQGGGGRFRSGSLTNPAPDPGLVRKGSGRAVRKEQSVPESGEEGTTETGNFSKGLSRQSSLPSRKGVWCESCDDSTDQTGFNRVNASPPEPLPINTNAPPRPPRRTNGSTPASQTMSHSASQSLSSLAMVSPPPTTLDAPLGAGLSRAQSLRAQAKHADSSGLGRSTSLKASGEVCQCPSDLLTRQHHRPMQGMSQVSPPIQPTAPRNPFNPPSPPPASSTAALPPFRLPDRQVSGDLKRHQSLTQGYGSSSRVRERLEKSPAVLTLEQRENLRRRLNQEHAQRTGSDNVQSPTSPIGRSVWSPSQVGDDGWARPNTHLADNFQAMNLGMPGEQSGIDRKLALMTEVLRQPRPQVGNGGSGGQQHLGDEPSWVANLVGHADRLSPQPPRSATAPNWQERDFGGIPQGWEPAQFVGQSFGYLPHHQQLLAAGYGGQPGNKSNAGQYQQPFYMIPSFYPSPPGTALPSSDASVIELARTKGLNPATYDCNPPQARFFVIKSYTEDDVQKSLKHEIWSSTVLGNKRLDGAFRESSDKMPIYLFFSVNGSRHFCGVAQMLTPWVHRQD